MRQFIARNEKTIEWVWRIAALVLLMGGAFMQLTYAKRDDVVQLRHEVQTLATAREDARRAIDGTISVQSQLATEVAKLSKEVAVLAIQVSANNAQQEKTNARLDRIVEQRVGAK